MTGTSAKPQLAAYLRVVPRPDARTGNPVAWLEDRVLPQALVEAFLSVPLLTGIRVGRANDKRLARTTLEKAKALVATGGEIYVELRCATQLQPPPA
ncbi:MAG: hypothetical protein IPI67_39005 [Myxococcales bacterium]|nr:hypothetical protein [Myxococcales bacterium]